MRLFTHNFLQCHVKGCTSNNFPLSLSETEIAQREAEFSSDFMKAYMCKLDYVALLATINEVGSIVWDASDCGPSDAPSLCSLNWSMICQRNCPNSLMRPSFASSTTFSLRYPLG